MKAIVNQQCVEKSFVYYLPVLITCALLVGLPCSMCISCASIMYPAVAETLQVPVSQVSIYSSMTFLSSIFISAPMGKWLQKKDIRIVLSVVLTILCLSLIAMSQATVVWQFWIAGFTMGIGTCTLMGLTPAVLINNWFKKHNGLLLGLVMAFSGIGGALLIPVGQYIIETYSWRMTYLTWAVSSFIVCLPLILACLRNTPQQKGMLPYGTAQAIKNKDEDAGKDWNVPIKVALRNPVFWVLGIVLLLSHLSMEIAFFFPAYVKTLEAVAVPVIVTGAVLSSITMAGQAIGKIILGIAGDGSVKYALIASCAFGALGILGCWLGPDTVFLPIGGLAFGFFYAFTNVLGPMLTRSIFGNGQLFSEHWAYLNVIATIGSTIGLFFWPAVAENLGGYGADFVVGIAISVVMLIMGLWCLKAGKTLPRVHTDDVDDA